MVLVPAEEGRNDRMTFGDMSPTKPKGVSHESCHGSSYSFRGYVMLAHSGLPGRRASGRPGRPGPAGEWKPELISIRVNKPGPRREMAPGRSLPRTGTYLALWIPDPEKRLVRFERGQSKLEAFTDEKGTDLSKITLRPFGWSRFGTFHASRSTEGSEGFLVEVAGEGLPAPGATKIQLKATLAFSQGSSEKTVEEKNLRVQEAREIEVGAVTLYMEPPGAAPVWIAGPASASNF